MCLSRHLSGRAGGSEVCQMENRWGGSGRWVCLASPGGTSRLEDSHLWSTPVAFPFCRTYGVPRQSSAARKAL